MVIENLIQTEIVTGAALLGISSVTSIWKSASGDNESSGNVSVGPSQKGLSMDADRQEHQE